MNTRRLIAISLPPLLLLLLVGGLLLAAWHHNQQHLIYPLDDTYIHLSLARHLATTGNWGLSPGTFNSCGSSLLYVPLLAGLFKVVGVVAWLPLLVNVLAALGLLYVLHLMLEQAFPSAWWYSLCMCLLLLLLPLHLLVLSGMEHSLQLLAKLLFVWAAARSLEQQTSSPPLWQLAVLALLTGMLRYEGLFLICVVAGLLALQKRLKPALAVLGAGCLPMLVYGCISVAKGAWFFPNSILSKGHLPIYTPEGFVAWLRRAVEVLYENPFMWEILLLSGGMAFALGFWHPRARQAFYVNLIAFLTGLLHLLFAEVGGYRYEAYLVLLSLVGAVLGGRQLLAGLRLPASSPLFISASLLLGILLAFPLLVRSGFFSLHYVQSTQNIYQQQYQMARFLAQYYPGGRVAANDVGAITFFADIQLLDLVGIGGHEVIELQKAGKLNAEGMAALAAAKGIQIAMVHDIWVENRLPASWIQVARWQIPDNFICAHDVVSFYAASEAEAQRLRRHLADFAPTLPPQVKVLPPAGPEEVQN